MIKLSQVELYYEHLPSALQGFRILHMGDLHTRKYGKKEALTRKVIEQGADLLFFSGDFCFQMGISNPLVKTADLHSHDIGFGWKGFHLPPDVEMATEVAQKMFEGITFPYGMFSVQGNHDPEEILPVLAELKFNILRNYAIQVPAPQGTKMNIFGVHCYDRDPIDIPKTLSYLDPDLFTLGSCHYPEMAEPLAMAGVDLNLAGHTHGGQVCLPGGKTVMTHSLTGKKYASGLSRVGNGVTYTTRGIGYSMLPIRTFCSSEIVEFTLRKGGPDQTRFAEKKILN